ncbi:hypothetical protein, partial [Desulfovibrio piger]
MEKGPPFPPRAPLFPPKNFYQATKKDAKASFFHGRGVAAAIRFTHYSKSHLDHAPRRRTMFPEYGASPYG